MSAFQKRSSCRFFSPGTQIVTHVWVPGIENDLSEGYKCVSPEVCSVWAAKILGDSSWGCPCQTEIWGQVQMRRASSLWERCQLRYIIMLKSLVTGAAVLGAVAFNILSEILSGQWILLVLGLTSDSIVSVTHLGHSGVAMTCHCFITIQ